MPYARPERCPVPGCHELTTARGRCDEHQRKAWANPSANTRTLTRTERRRFHDMVLRGNPACACTGWCGEHIGACTTPATEADHIVPIALGGAHHARENGQALCTACHAIKSHDDAIRTREARRYPRR